MPVGILTFHACSAWSTSFSPICCAASLSGSTCTRTAYLAAPHTFTWATPLTCEMRCAIVVSAYSFSFDSGSVGELSASIRIGKVAGIRFAERGRIRHARRQQRHARGDGRFHVHFGAVDIAAQIELQRDRRCCPASSSKPSNPGPAMEVNCRSSGVATEFAMVSGFAPGRLAAHGQRRESRRWAGRSPAGRR